MRPGDHEVEADLVLEKPSVVGRVLAPQGIGLARVEVIVESADTHVIAAGETNDRGEFSIGPLVPGRHTLHLYAGSLALLSRKLGGKVGPSSVELTIEGGKDTRCDVKIGLERGSR